MSESGLTAMTAFEGGARPAVLFAPCALLPDGWAQNVRVSLADNGTISAVDTDVAPRIGDIELRDRVLLPAPSNLHSHSFQRAMVGRTQLRGPGKDSFWSWRQLMYRFLDALTPDMVEAITAQAYVEMCEAGYAAVAEFHYLHHAAGGVAYDNPAETSVAAMAAARTAGIGLTHLPVVYAAAGADGRAPEGGQLRFACDLGRYEALWAAANRALVAHGRADWGIGIAPHSLRAVPPALLRDVLSAHASGPIHVHIAEQTAEVAEIEAAWGARPVEWLLDQHDVDARWCLVHATHLTEAECTGLAHSGATAGLCPITEADLGDGVFPGEAFLDAGGGFGVGTDSNVHITLTGELRALEYSQRLVARRRNVLAAPAGSTARRLFEHALAGGAQALARVSGAIAPGHLADLLTLDTSHVQLHGFAGDALLDAWLFSTTEPVVDAVWSAGQRVVVDGEHVHRAEVSRRFKSVMDTLVQDL